MHVRFLLGPAGSGKTHRCLEEVRSALAARPFGGPLIFLAPKQATFQIERQLLDPKHPLEGFSRLNIFSFDRLAKFIFETLNVAPPKLLSSEGRVMVLRALLMRHAGELKLFHRSARRTGFALELSAVLSELQQHQFTPAKLRAIAGRRGIRAELGAKLLDLALLLEKYGDWLQANELQDADCLLTAATSALKTINHSSSAAINFSGLWLDGFAEMTPQELDFLAAVIPFCETATLAFCLESEDPQMSRLSIWSSIGKTFEQCRARIESLAKCKIHVEALKRSKETSRFAGNTGLAILEKQWSLASPHHASLVTRPDSIFISACANPEAEAVLAARKILEFIRAGNRFRDCAVLVRNLEPYHKPLTRQFRRYGIPFFLDRRESVAHHPLAELTRSVLRTIAFDWNNDDFFAALKTGFFLNDDRRDAGMLTDRLENAALEFGWHGQKWLEPLPDEFFERLRQQLIVPFQSLSSALARMNFKPNGVELADLIRAVWNDLDAEATLEQWTIAGENSAATSRQPAIHATVWDQLNAWLDNVALAFPGETLPLREWLAILDAGLAGLTVGVIPPALDEVLIGAVDRSRNPDLKFALILGMNESVFPAPPMEPAILTRSDRDELENNVRETLGPNLFDQISRERYLGYIACTRSAEKLQISFSRQDADGKALNESPFIGHLKRIFPELKTDEFSEAIDWRNAGHVCEIVEHLFPGSPSGLPTGLPLLPGIAELQQRLSQLREPDPKENVSPDLAEKIYGPILKASVSRLEEFASCPFKFFVHVGLRADERKVFELDARERGSFQHEILKKFHDDLDAEGKRWRDLVPAEARDRIAKISAELEQTYNNGLLAVDARSRFAARMITVSLQDFVETMVTWMRGQYGFDPVKAELGFGFEDSSAPAWEIDLGDKHKLALRGRIDRIDVCRDGDRALCVVTDYKSSQRKLDNIFVEHGVQLQLLAYLGAVRRWPAEILGAKKIIPAGVFYVNLRGQFEGSDSRTEALSGAETKRKFAYRHNGRFDAEWLDKFDSAGAADQFNYRLKKDGTLYSNSPEALTHAAFGQLLDTVENQLREIGRAIFDGKASVEPYRKGSGTACDFCDYRMTCRIDPWVHPFRVLRATETEA